MLIFLIIFQKHLFELVLPLLLFQAQIWLLQKYVELCQLLIYGLLGSSIPWLGGIWIHFYAGRFFCWEEGFVSTRNPLERFGWRCLSVDAFTVFLTLSIVVKLVHSLLLLKCKFWFNILTWHRHVIWGWIPYLLAVWPWLLIFDCLRREHTDYFVFEIKI